MVGDVLKIVAAVGAVLAACGHAAGARRGAAAGQAGNDRKLSRPGGRARRRLRSPLAFRLAALEHDQVRITYVGHSTFLIESPQLVRIATDYNDYVKPPVLPDIVTMNHAHSTHYTDHPDPGIKHVLRGWAEDEKPARIDLQYKDVRVRNVPTNIRTLGRRHRAPRQFDLHLRDRQSVHRPSRPSASHADAAAAQRDRPHRRGDGAGGRQHTRSTSTAWSRCCTR